MTISIKIPRLGWSMEEGVFGEWLKAPGEFVQAGEMIFLLEGEKAAQEIESFDSGYLCVPADAPQPGTTVKVGEVIGFLLAEGEPVPTSVRVISSDSPTNQPLAPASSQSSCHAPQLTTSHNTASHSTLHPAATNSTASLHSSSPRAAGPAARRLARELGIDLNAVFTPDATGRVLSEDVQRAAARGSVKPQFDRPIATPRARRRARELGVDWSRLTGTGRNGRIRERDVQIPSQIEFSEAPSQEPAPTEPGRHVPASKLRLSIAKRMTMGAHQAAPVTLTTKINASTLVAFREQLKQDAAGLVPSYNDILIHFTAQTLRQMPDLNACWYRNGIYIYDTIHIATAVDTSDGLLAPIVRHADQRTLLEIAEQTRQLVAQARAGQLTLNQLIGGTFTISNLGMFGIDAFTPVLNLPQAAILGIGRIVEEPVLRNGRLEVGQTLTLSLTFDHRVVDGAPAARWLQCLCQRIEEQV